MPFIEKGRKTPQLVWGDISPVVGTTTCYGVAEPKAFQFVRLGIPQGLRNLKPVEMIEDFGKPKQLSVKQEAAMLVMGVIHEAAFAKNIRLFNTPDQHTRAQEFDVAYPFIEDLTPRSLTLRSSVDCPRAAREIGFPMFLKGAVQSRKARGWRACVARDEAELNELAAHLWSLENRSRGRVIARELVKLRHSRTHDDFPLGREYRVFLLQGEILSLGYYWPGADPLAALSHAETQAVRALAFEAARRLQVPYIAVDIRQLENEKWIVIEVGDAQFAGLSCNSPLALWNRLVQEI